MPGLADTAKLIASLELQDKFSGPARKIEGSLSRLDRGFSRMGKGAGQLAAGLGRVGLIGATAVVGGLATAVKLAGDFEAQLNTINTIVKLNDRDLKALGEGIRQTFRDTGQPLEDLTSAYYDLLSAGIKVEDAQSLLNTSVKLGIGGLATTEEAVNLLTTAVNAYGLNVGGANKAADIFAAAVRDGKVTVAEIAGSFADVAPLAAQFGVKLEEVGAAYAVLTGRGVLAAEVGTQFNRTLIEGLKPGPQLTKVLDKLSGSFEDLVAQQGLVETLEDIRIEAAKQGIDFEDLFGRVEAYKFALATTGPNLAAFRREQEKMGEATGEVNAQFAERQQGLNFQLSKLKALAQDAGITIGTALLPKLVPLVEKLNDFIQRNQGKIEKFAEDLAKGFSAFAKSVQETDFSGAIATLKILGEVGKKVVDIFLSLPPGIQAAVITGAAINKLSGGLLGAGAGNIIGGAGSLFFDRFLARGSSAVNPVWVQSAIGGVGGGQGPGIVPFGLGDIVKAAFVVWAGSEGQKFASDFMGQNNPITPDLADITGDQSMFDIWANGLNERAANALLTNLGQFDPLNRGGTRKPVSGAGKTGRAALPDTALPRLLDVTLPDTAMSSLSRTSTEVSKLPAILTRQEAAQRATSQRIAETKGAIGIGFGNLAQTVRSSQDNLRVQVNVTSNVSVDNVLRKTTSALIASGKINAIGF